MFRPNTKSLKIQTFWENFLKTRYNFVSKSFNNYPIFRSDQVSEVTDFEMTHFFRKDGYFFSNYWKKK